MNYRKWRLGLLVATLSGLLTAGSGLAAGDMSWRAFTAVLCTSLMTNLGNFLKQHPIEDIQDTTFLKKPDGK